MNYEFSIFVLIISVEEAVLKVNNFFTAKNTRFTQRTQCIDNQNCDFVNFVVSLCPLWLKILSGQPHFQFSIFN
jgi:hypothetical protein